MWVSLARMGNHRSVFTKGPTSRITTGGSGPVTIRYSAVILANSDERQSDPVDSHPSPAHRGRCDHEPHGRNQDLDLVDRKEGRRSHRPNDSAAVQRIPRVA